MRAAELAGRALDPTAPGGPDHELARVLLREAVMWSAAAVTAGEPAPTTLSESITRLERLGVLAKVGASNGAVATELELLDVVPATKDVATLELLVAGIAEAAAGKRRLARARRLRRFGVIGLVMAAAIIVPGWAYFRFASDSYPFRVSSAQKGFPEEGFIGRVSAYGLVMHTQQQAEPWMEIDLEKIRTVSSVLLKSRADCCTERGLPMIIEVAGEDKAWEIVGERDKPFDRWLLKFPERQARWVRVRSTANTVLHFREIKVR